MRLPFPEGTTRASRITSKQMFKEVYAAVAADKQSTDTYATFADGLRELVLCEKIIESDKKAGMGEGVIGYWFLGIG